MLYPDLTLSYIDCLSLRERISHQPESIIARPTRRLTVPRGAVVKRALHADPELLYFLYWPKRAQVDAPILVTVHGISRNAFEQMTAFAELAERHGIVLVAPLFTPHRFRDYQRLGRCGRRADRALDGILAEVGHLTAAHTARVCLFGYSGGAQFVHRYAMAYPNRVKTAGVAAAGWYTFPDPALNFPYGIRPTSNSSDLRFEPSQFLRVPMHVWVGERDITRDAALRQSKRVDQQQGMNRVERAQRWVAAMQLAATHAKVETSYSMTLLPRSNHSFRRCVKRGQLTQRVFNTLFEADKTDDGF